MRRGEQAERAKAARAGLNDTHATILDMSATELLKAVSRVFHTRGAVSNALVMGAFSLGLAGCGSLQPTTTATTTPTPQGDTKATQELVSAPKQSETPARPVQPLRQQPRRVSEPQRPAATPSKAAENRVATPSRGAETLVALNTPLVARARERTKAPTERSGPTAPMAADSGTVTGAPVRELIFKGPPPKARPQRAGMKMVLWLGLGLGGAAVVVLGRFVAIRGSAKSPGPADAAKDELKMPSEILMKKPLNLPQ